LPSSVGRIAVWSDVYLDDFMAFVPWIGLAVAGDASPLIARSAILSEDQIYALMLIAPLFLTGLLLPRNLGLRRLAIPGYLTTVTLMVPPPERIAFNGRLKQHLDRSLPFERADAIRIYRAAPADMKGRRDERHWGAISQMQRQTVGNTAREMRP
jgi:hypothetical protein